MIKQENCQLKHKVQNIAGGNIIKTKQSDAVPSDIKYSWDLRSYRDGAG